MVRFKSLRTWTTSSKLPRLLALWTWKIGEWKRWEAKRVRCWKRNWSWKKTLMRVAFEQESLSMVTLKRKPIWERGETEKAVEREREKKQRKEREDWPWRVHAIDELLELVVERVRKGPTIHDLGKKRKSKFLIWGKTKQINVSRFLWNTFCKCSLCSRSHHSLPHIVHENK